jgi:hypothetical protein
MALPAEVLTQVTKFLMLTPEVMTSSKNMDALLAPILRRWKTYLTRATATQARPMIVFQVEGKKKSRTLLMTVHEPFLNVHEWTESCQESFYTCEHPATGDGLLKCLMEAKAALVSLNRGLCPECATAEPPRKRLKGPGMSTCEHCCMLNAIGL